MDEEQVENPLTAAFWINLVLVIIGIIVVSRLTVLAQKEEPSCSIPTPRSESRSAPRTG